MNEGINHLEQQRCSSLGQLLTSKDSSLRNKQASPKKKKKTALNGPKQGGVAQWESREQGSVDQWESRDPKDTILMKNNLGDFWYDSVFLGLGIPGYKMNASELACSVVDC